MVDESDARMSQNPHMCFIFDQEGKLLRNYSSDAYNWALKVGRSCLRKEPQNDFELWNQVP